MVENSCRHAISYFRFFTSGLNWSTEDNIWVGLQNYKMGFYCNSYYLIRDITPPQASYSFVFDVNLINQLLCLKAMWLADNSKWKILIWKIRLQFGSTLHILIQNSLRSTQTHWWCWTLEHRSLTLFSKSLYLNSLEKFIL